MNALVRWVPDIGDIIQLREDHPSRIREAKYPIFGVSKWRVTGFMKAYIPPPRKKPSSFGDLLDEILADSCREFDHGKGKTRLQWCHRSAAEYVTGSGVAGCCHLISDIVKVGTVNWSPIMIEQDRISSYHHIGHILF